MNSVTSYTRKVQHQELCWLLSPQAIWLSSVVVLVKLRGPIWEFEASKLIGMKMGIQ